MLRSPTTRLVATRHCFVYGGAACTSKRWFGLFQRWFGVGSAWFGLVRLKGVRVSCDTWFGSVPYRRRHPREQPYLALGCPTGYGASGGAMTQFLTRLSSLASANAVAAGLRRSTLLCPMLRADWRSSALCCVQIGASGGGLMAVYCHGGAWAHVSARRSPSLLPAPLYLMSSTPPPSPSCRRCHLCSGALAAHSPHSCGHAIGLQAASFS